MINILEDNFLSLVRCGGTLYYVVGIILAFLKVPKMEVFRPYYISKNLLSACFFVVGTNKSYLSAYINRKFDMSFSSWITSHRIKEAKEMLRKDPSTKVETVAFDVGFSSSSYFSKAFSKHEGMSPAQWKKSLGMG